MIIFQGPNKKIVFIHIPKNSGRHIRQCISSNHRVLYSFWDVGKIDRAHIPFSMRKIFISNPNQYRYFTFVRNPYDRFISAFKYKFPRANISQMKEFIINILPTYTFDKQYNPKIIHFYPQYMFLINEKDELNEVHKKIEVKKLENIKNFKIFPVPNFKLTKYNYNDYFNQECIDVLNEVYKQDFESFKYPLITYKADTE